MKNAQFQSRYSAVVSTLALVVSLTLGGAYAVEQLGKNSVGPKQIRANAVKAKEIAKKAVRSKEIATDAVGTQEIGDDQVQPENVSLPAPALAAQAGEVVVNDPPGTFAKAATLATYAKVDPTSVLRVSWSGVIKSIGASCVFQVRVNGETDSSGAGQVLVTGTISASTDALFSGLLPGPHEVELWVRSTSPGASNQCTVSPAGLGVDQTVVVSEEVV